MFCFSSKLTIHAGNDNENDMMFPSAFLSPQSLPSHNTTIGDDDIYNYCDDKNSSILSDYQPISPPAEYAEFNCSPTYQSSRRDNR